MSNFDQMPDASNDSLLRCPERNTLGVPPPREHSPHGRPPADGAALGAAGQGAPDRQEPKMSVPAKVFEDRETPGQWRVEWFDDAGRTAMEIFTGHDARQQPLGYVKRKYGHFRDVQIEHQRARALLAQPAQTPSGR